MKFDRTKNASRNIVFGLIQRIYQLIVPFVMRTAMIYWLGVEYLGLDGLFTSILSVLNLAELGVGSAMVYSMYKPVAEDNKLAICALMKLYKIYYRVIGLIVLVGGLVLCPFIPKLISEDLPVGLNVYILFLLNLAATVLSYWLFAYKNSLLQAYQRLDISSKVMMAVNTVRYIIQFFVLFFLHNYYIYLIVALASQAVINISTAVIVDKMYPNLEPKGNIPDSEKKVINQRIRDLFTSKVGSVIVNSVDTIVVSAFLGLTVLAVYQNYYYIISALLSVVNILIFSCMSGVGNSIITETKEKNFNDLKTFTFIVSGIACFCTACLMSIFQPFMLLWVKNESLMFGYPAVICFSVYFFIVQINTLLNMYKDAAGIWHEDRFRPLVTAFVNLGLNLIMVQFCGIYGILLSTVLSMLLVGMPWLLVNLFTTIFEKKMFKLYLKPLMKYIVVTAIVVVLSVCACRIMNLSGFLAVILYTIVCGVLTVFVFVLLFRKSVEFERAIVILNNVTRGKLKLTKLLKNN